MGCCRSFSGITRDCDSTVGGVRRAWISCYDEITNVTVSDNVITSISGGDWKEYEFKKQTASFSQEFQAGDAQYWSQSISLQFNRNETPKRIEIEALSTSDLVIIVQDNNGRYWYFGYDTPVTVASATSESGTSFDDFSGYQISFEATDFRCAYEVNESAMSGII